MNKLSVAIASILVLSACESLPTKSSPKGTSTSTHASGGTSGASSAPGSSGSSVSTGASTTVAGGGNTSTDTSVQTTASTVNCAAGFVLYGSQCIAQTQSCGVANGTGTQSFANGTYGACAAVSCNSGYSLYNGQCYAQTKACTVPNGAGLQTFANGAYGACAITACNSGYKLSGGACVSVASLALFKGAVDLGNGHADLLFQETNGDVDAWVGNGGYDYGDKRSLTFGGIALSVWNPAGTTRFLGSFDLGNGHPDLLFQEASGDIYAWIGIGGYDFGDKRALTFGGHPLSFWNPAGTSKFIGAFDLGNGHADLLFQEANGDIEAWIGNGGYDFGVYTALTFGGKKLSYWNPAATSRFVGAFDLGNGHADLLFQEANGDIEAWIGNGGYDFGVYTALTFGGQKLSYGNPAATSRFVGAANLGNGHPDLLFQEANGDVEAWLGNGGYDFGVYTALTFGGRKLSGW
jgi:hypothetical protein